MITLKELQDEWAVDCKIDELELGKATIKTAELHSKYLNHLSNFKLQLAKIRGSILQAEKNQATILARRTIQAGT